MSQPHEYPSFNITNEPYYTPGASEQSFNASFPQWTAQGPRSVGQPAPSPSLSVRTARSAPNPRLSGQAVNFNSQPADFQRDNRIDPNLRNLDLLTVPTRFHAPIMDNSNPIARFYSEDMPWSSESRRNRNVSFERTANDRFAFAHHSQPNMYSYRDGPSSEAESLTAPRTDSGYHTIPPQSLVGHDPEHVDPDLGFDVTQQVSNISVSESGDVFGGPRSMTDAASVISGRSATRSHGREIICPECKEVSKCQSDHKKHMLRHNKPFKCEIPNCRRAGRGFTTINDLNRHRKSVHRIGATENSFQCASDTCRSKEKIWPRLDNFKQHIHRMHKDEDENDLIKRSAYRQPDPSPTDDSLSVAPMDTTLAGIGTERQFSNSSNELDDPVSGISLTPDQDSHQWTFNPTIDEFSVATEQPHAAFFSHHAEHTSGSKARTQTQPSSSSSSSGTSTTPNGLIRRESFKLDTLAHVASSQPTTSKPMQRPPPTLSNAPQTKVDQQKALQRLSNVILRDLQNAHSQEPKDLESIIMHTLATTFARKDGQSDNPLTQASHSGSSSQYNSSKLASEDNEASKATKEIPNPYQKAPINRSRRLLSTSDWIKCERCAVSVARACDMRKHMKRHTRPYGCTYPKCNKRFGAKSDWKRHENSQHFQLESFRCALTSPHSQTPCGELFYRSKAFEKHLTEEHKMHEQSQREDEVRLRRIGKNGQGQFWCGFCERIVKLEKKRTYAWDERFDHIDRHFSKEKKSIEEWHCVEARKPKGEVLREIDRLVFDDYDTEGHSPEDECDEEGGTPESTAVREPMPASARMSNPKKRHANGDPPSNAPSQKRIKPDTAKYCCRCQSGPWTTHTYLNCLECDHQWCSSCNSAEVQLEQ